jgi:hypothetical protein
LAVRLRALPAPDRLEDFLVPATLLTAFGAAFVADCFFGAF